MIPVISIYNDVIDDVNEDENGSLNYAMFNRLSKRAEIRILDWLTGNVRGDVAPIPYLTQKNRDLIMHLITPWRKHVANGKVGRPNDYYSYENLSRLVGKGCDESDTDTPKTSCDVPIELLSNQAFNTRCKSFITGLNPTPEKPIAKAVGDTFVFKPSDIGDIELEYIRYPKFAQIRTKFDEVYNEEIPDESKSDNYEWPEGIRESLVWVITDLFSVHNRERALKEANLIKGKNEGERR